MPAAANNRSRVQRSAPTRAQSGGAGSRKVSPIRRPDTDASSDQPRRTHVSQASCGDGQVGRHRMAKRVFVDNNSVNLLRNFPAAKVSFLDGGRTDESPVHDNDAHSVLMRLLPARRNNASTEAPLLNRSVGAKASFKAG